MNEKPALPTGVTSPDLEIVIAGWLHAKFHRSLSEKTRTAYTQTIEQFRASLKLQDLDLDSQATRECRDRLACRSFSPEKISDVGEEWVSSM